MHKLIIEDDEGKTVAVPLIRDEITIGRQEGNTIRLTERNVSRKHARILRRDGLLVVEDVGSYTGTKVNGTPIAGPAPLNDGDLIVIGDYKLGIREDRVNATMRYGGDGTVAPPVAPPPVFVPPANIPAPIEGAPTIPVRALMDQPALMSPMGVREIAPPATPPARVVVLSTPLAGAEFSLDRPSLVIGRTPENDVVLNHKSISRHHAKIIRDGNRYVVVDLESANGVRVNGSEYERVELQAGDVLELGHVRLRFVGGDEKYTFDPHALRLGGLGGGSRRTLVFAGAGAAVVALVLVIAFTGGSEQKPVASAPVAAAPVVAPVTPPAPPPPAAESAATLIEKAKAALTDENWTEALDSATKATAADPASTEASDLKKTIELERESATQFAALKRASEEKNFETVMSAFGAIPDSSMYKDRARTLEREARGQALAQHVAMAEKQRAAGECDQATREAELALALDPTSEDAKEAVAARCKAKTSKPAPVAAAPRPVTPRPSKPTPVATAQRAETASRAEAPSRPVRAAAAPAAAQTKAAAALTPPPEEAAPAAVDPEELLAQAQDASLRGQYAAAIEASRRALRVRPGLTRAYQIIAMSSCYLKDAGDAKKAYDRVEDRMKPLVRSICQKNGITVE